MWTFTSRTKTSSVDSSGEGAFIPPKKKCQYTRERKCVCTKWFVKKKKKRTREGEEGDESITKKKKEKKIQSQVPKR